MCGIAGILRFDAHPVDPAPLQSMRDHLRHRGPDGEGIARSGPCGLAHTRLAIIDLLGGEQPMRTSGAAAAESGGPATGPPADLSLVFNGEIYNHRALRRKLERLGYAFESDHCDTEVLLHGYRAFGTELPKHLHGMFAFAIWDAGEETLFLCRDRAGKKPLYLRWIESADGRPRQLHFASLIATLFAGAGCPGGEGIAPAIDRVALLTCLRLGYVTGPSLLHGIEELPPAHWMSVDRSGAARCEPYWRPPPISRSSTRLGVVEATSEVISEAVEHRLAADVPLGCFLSGGIDSSLVAAFAAEHLRRRGEGPLRTFNLSVEESDYDESEAARRVARAIGSEHTVLKVSCRDRFFEDVEHLVALSGEPTADSSLLATYWLSRAARAHVKAVLTGDGGDELFGGYDRYRAMRFLARHRWWCRRLPAGLLPAGEPRRLASRVRRLLEAARCESPAAQYHAMVHLFSDRQIHTLGALPRVPPPALRDWPDEPNPVSAAMRWDLVHYLPFDLLRKVDRASMAVALEARCPLLDTEVMDLAGHLPESVLMPRGRPKGLLRQVAARHLPAAIVRRPKRGFALPIGTWFRGPLRDGLADRLFSGDLATLGLDPAPARRWFEQHIEGRHDHTHRLFGLLELATWARWLQTAGKTA